VLESTAAEVMVTRFPRIRADQTLRQAVEALLRSGWQSGLVLSPKEELSGTLGRAEVLQALSKRTGGYFSEEELGFALIRGEVFDCELLRELWRSFWQSPVSGVMRREVPTVDAGDPVRLAARRMTAGNDIVAVVRGSRVVGAVRPREVLTGLVRRPERVRGKRHPRPAPRPA